MYEYMGTTCTQEHLEALRGWQILLCWSYRLECECVLECVLECEAGNWSWPLQAQQKFLNAESFSRPCLLTFTAHCKPVGWVRQANDYDNVLLYHLTIERATSSWVSGCHLYEGRSIILLCYICFFAMWLLSRHKGNVIHSIFKCKDYIYIYTHIYAYTYIHLSWYSIL